MIINFTSSPANLKATCLLSYFSRTTGIGQKITLLEKVNTILPFWSEIAISLSTLSLFEIFLVLITNNFSSFFH